MSHFDGCPSLILFYADTQRMSTDCEEDDSSARPTIRKIRRVLPEKDYSDDESSNEGTIDMVPAQSVNDMQEDESEREENGLVATVCRSTSQRRRTLRVKWSADELNLIRRIFANFFSSGTLPGFAIISEAQRNHPVLSKRTTAQIKSRFQQLLKMRDK